MDRDLDNLTPLDSRNSLLMEPTTYKTPLQHGSDRKDFNQYRDGGRQPHRESTDNLIATAAPLGLERGHSHDDRDRSPYYDEREPKLPRF